MEEIGEHLRKEYLGLDWISPTRSEILSGANGVDEKLKKKKSAEVKKPETIAGPNATERDLKPKEEKESEKSPEILPDGANER